MPRRHSIQLPTAARYLPPADTAALHRSPELTPTWTSHVWCLVPASARAVAPGPSGTGPALPSPQAFCLSEELPARGAACSSIPAPVRSPIPMTGLVFAPRQGTCCTIAAKLRVQSVPDKGDDPPECCQLFITLVLATAHPCSRTCIAYGPGFFLGQGRGRYLHAALLRPLTPLSRGDKRWPATSHCSFRACGAAGCFLSARRYRYAPTSVPPVAWCWTATRTLHSTSYGSDGAFRRQRGPRGRALLEKP
jgi:hypothetical protein